MAGWSWCVKVGFHSSYQGCTCRAVAVNCAGARPFLLLWAASSSLAQAVKSMRNQMTRVLGKSGPCPRSTCCPVFFLLPAFLLCSNHLEVTFPKQRALGHLSTADDQWEVRASVLQGMMRSTDSPLGKNSLVLGFCRVILQALSSVLQPCGFWSGI